MRRREKFANIVLVSGIIYCIAVLLYSRFLSSLSPEQLNKYYLAAVTGLLIFAIAFKWREEWKVNFALTVLAIGFSLYLIEIVLFFGLTERIKQLRLAEQMRVEAIEHTRQTGHPFDERTKWQVMMDFRKKGIEIYPAFSAFFLRRAEGLHVDGNAIYPLGGISEKLTIHCNESGEWSIYESDEHGFNNPLGIYGQQGLDIVLLGDSFTHGACVKPGQDIGGQLRRGNRRVLNLGISGNGPLTELATLKEYGVALKPRIVLWLYFEENDLDDLAIEQSSSLLLRYVDDDFSQSLLQRQPEIDQVLINYIQNKIERIEKYQASPYFKLEGIFTLSNLRKELTFKLVGGLSYGKRPLVLFRQILSEAKETVNAWDGQFYFVYLPAWSRYNGNLGEHNYYRNEVLSLVKALSIPIIDFDAVMSTHPDPLSLYPFRMPVHYTAEGYRLIAEQIERDLKLDAGD